jgi:hypothetical protein
MNGLHVLILAAVIVGAAYIVPRLMRLDAVLADMDNLDDEELAAVLAEFPDVLVRAARW